jgi:filamentous hemagglutinin
LTGQVSVTVAKEVLSTASEKMRDYEIENSKKSPGIVDSKSGQVLSNSIGSSEGVQGDGFKLAGTRVDLDRLCGESRCEKNDDGSLRLDALGRVQFKEDKAGNSLYKFLDIHPDGQKMSGLTGGVQGAQGTIGGIDYKSGDFNDRWLEQFAGPHDFIGGTLSGLYDKEGNAKRGMSKLENSMYDRWSEVAIPISAPFALSRGLSSEEWKILNIFLGVLK